MSRQISLITLFLFFATGLLAQQKSERDSSIDFFKDPKKLLCWSGPVSGSFKSNKHIAAVPLMQFFDVRIGTARIICKPNYGFDKWNAIAIKNRSNEAEKVLEIATNKSIQKNFMIYAFLMDSKYLVPPTEKPYFPNEKEMEFPAPIRIYQRHGQVWRMLTKVNVKTWSEYSDLQMRYLIGQ